MVQLVPEPVQPRVGRRRGREGREVAGPALDDGRGPADAIAREERGLEPELAGAPQVQALRVSAAPRELEQPGRGRAGDAERVDQAVLVEALELSHRGRRGERPLRAGIVECARRLEPGRGARQPGGDLEPHGECGQERLAGQPLALAHGERGGQHGAARMRAGEGLALEGADEHAVGERGASGVGAPALVDHRGLRRSAEAAEHLEDPARPRLDGADERGGERVEHGELEVLHEARRQVGEARARGEVGERAGGAHAGLPITSVSSRSEGTVSVVPMASSYGAVHTTRPAMST